LRNYFFLVFFFSSPRDEGKSHVKNNSPVDKTIFFLKRVYTETPHLRIRTSCLPPSAKDVDIWVREVCCENTLDHKVLEIPTCIKRSLIKKKFVKKIYNTGTD